MENLITQSFVSIPVFFVTIAVLFLAISVKNFRKTGFFIVGSIMALLNIVSGLIFWATEPNIEEVRSYTLISNVLFSSQAILFFLGIIQILLEKRSPLTAKQNVFLLIMLSIVTLGFYLPYWYVKLPVKYRLSNSVIIVFVMLWMPVLLMHVYEFSGESVKAMATLLTEIVAGGVALWMAFNLREKMLQENEELDVDPILTFFFGIFYLQYKINQSSEVPGSLP